MKRLGTVLHVIDDLLIVNIDKTYDVEDFLPNSTVITKEMKNIGKIKELFGPVDNPYFTIKLFKNLRTELLKLKNERVYLK